MSHYSSLYSHFNLAERYGKTLIRRPISDTGSVSSCSVPEVSKLCKSVSHVDNFECLRYRGSSTEIGTQASKPQVRSFGTPESPISRPVYRYWRVMNGFFVASDPASSLP